MISDTLKLLALSLLTTAAVSFTTPVSAANALVDFGFDEGSGTKVTDSVNSLVGVPGSPTSPPTFVTDSPSGRAGDSAIHFEAGQYLTVEDPDTRIQFDQNNPSFTPASLGKIRWESLGPGWSFSTPAGRAARFPFR